MSLVLQAQVRAVIPTAYARTDFGSDAESLDVQIASKQLHSSGKTRWTLDTVLTFLEGIDSVDNVPPRVPH